MLFYLMSGEFSPEIGLLVYSETFFASADFIYWTTDGRTLDWNNGRANSKYKMSFLNGTKGSKELKEEKLEEDEDEKEERQWELLE